ncbi:MAG: hypothetical protein JJP05_07340 [cyanobacterium endosymbiont of Rhopalodia gibba]
MLVLTIGLLGLGLRLSTRPEISGEVCFSRIYNNGAN